MKHSFRPAPEGWSETLHLQDGRPAARLLSRGTEVHFEIDPEFRHRVIFRSVTRLFLKPAFEALGFLTTKVPLSADAERRFVTRLGFERTWSDGQFEYYMLTALPFEPRRK